jgi:hypothetical protein
MSGGKRNTTIVERTYQAAPDHCVRALALLLRTSIRKEAAQPTAPKDAKVRSNEFRAETILHQDP